MEPILDYYGRRDKPSILLCNPSLAPVSSLFAAYNVKNIQRFGALSQLDFDFPQSIDNGKTTLDAYNKLQSKMIVQLEGIGNYIITSCPENSDGSTPVKHVTALSIESELIYKRITGFNGTFKFYDRYEPDETILGKVLELAPNWTVDEIDSELEEMYRTFDVGNNTVYNFLTSDVANAFGCIFIFNTFAKTISAKLIKNLDENVGVYISLDNAAQSINITEYSDEISTALWCYGGDNLDIHMANPLGGNVIYNFDYYINDKTNDWMSDYLKEALNKWKGLLSSKTSEYRTLVLEQSLEIEKIITVSQNIIDLKSSIDALRLELEGLTAQPTDKMEEDVLAEHKAVISQKRSDIINQRIALRLLRRDKANIQNKIDNYAVKLRKVTNRLNFVGEKSLQNFFDDMVDIVENMQYIENNWKAVYFQTADELELDVEQFSELAPSVYEVTKQARESAEKLLEKVEAKLLRYWIMTNGDKEEIYSYLSFAIEKSEKAYNLLNSIISNMDIVINLKSDMTKMLSYSEIIDYDSNLSKKEYDELQNYIFDNTYTNNNIIITDVFTDKEIQEQSIILYDQSVDVLSRAAYPRYEFSGAFNNILSIEEFSSIIEKLELGKQVSIETPSGTVVSATLLEISYNYDVPEDFSMTFSNRVKLNYSNFKFADMFINISSGGNSGVAGITSGATYKSGNVSSGDSIKGENILRISNGIISKLGYVSFGPNPPEKYGGYVGSWLGYDRGAKFSLYSSENDYLQWDGEKLLVKAKNFTLDSGGNITASNADLSGKITAESGNIGGWNISSGCLIGSSNTVGMRSAGTSGSETRFWAGSADYTNAPFKVLQNGSFYASDAVINGEINAIIGSIGGWNISSGNLTSPSNNVGMRSIGTAGTEVRFWAGSPTATSAPFRVTDGGYLYANNAEIEGKIVSGEGEIAGWNITTGCLVDSSQKVGISSSGTTDESVRFWSGNANPNQAPFKVTQGGNLYADSAIIKGEITANSGKVGSWNITTGCLISDSATVGMRGHGTSDSEVRFWAGNATPPSAPFRVNQGGELYASNAEISGKISSHEGNIGGWDISSGCIISPSNTVGLNSAGTASSSVRFWAGHATPTSAPFRVTQAGELVSTNATITGKITANSGTIGKWNITTGSLVSTSGMVGMRGDGTGADQVRFWAGNVIPSTAPFRVTEDGRLHASNAVISGSISAETGEVGGWVVEEDRLINKLDNLNKVGLISGSSIDNIAIFAGNQNPQNAPFKIKYDGTLFSTSAHIEGSIFSGSGTIGGWVISTGCLLSASGNVGIRSSGISDSDVRFWAGDKNTANAEFRVLEDGSMFASSGSIGGWSINSSEIKKNGIILNSNDDTIYVGKSTYPRIIIDGGGAQIRSSTYKSGESGFTIEGKTGNAEFNNITARGEIRSSVFSYDEITATAGTFGVFNSAGTVKHQITIPSSGSFLLSIEDPAAGIPTYPCFNIGDIIRIKTITTDSGSQITGASDIWATVTNYNRYTDPSDSRNSCYRYTCNLKSGSQTTIMPGQSVISYGSGITTSGCPNGGGHLIMQAGSDGFSGPFYAVNTSGSQPWLNTLKQHVRLGNLKNTLGFTDDTYGIAIGTNEGFGNYLSYDSQSGVLKLRGAINIVGNPDDISVPWEYITGTPDFSGTKYYYTADTPLDKINTIILSNSSGSPEYNGNYQQIGEADLHPLYKKEGYNIIYNSSVSKWRVTRGSEYTPVYESNSGNVETPDLCSAWYYAGTANPVGISLELYYQTLNDKDIWINTRSDNQMYIWDSNYATEGGTGSWVSIRDGYIDTIHQEAINAQNQAINALGIAGSALALADGKITTFYASGIPNKEVSHGDLWMDSGAGNKLHIAYINGGGPVSGSTLAVTKGEDEISLYGFPASENVNSISDFDYKEQGISQDSGRKYYKNSYNTIMWNQDTQQWVIFRNTSSISNRIFYSQNNVSNPTNTVEWFADNGTLVGEVGDELTINIRKINCWIEIQDSEIAKAISDAANAQSTADGKIVTFYQNSEPASANEGDLWIDTDDGNRLYRYSYNIYLGQYKWVDVQDVSIQTIITELSNIGEDNLLTPTEKIIAKDKFTNEITNSHNIIIDLATNIIGNISPLHPSAPSISNACSVCNDKFIDLSGYLNNLLLDTTITSQISRNEWDLKWGDYYTSYDNLASVLQESSGSPVFQNIFNLPDMYATPNGQDPSGSGLYITSSHMGFYDGNKWMSYIESDGTFSFGDIYNSFSPSFHFNPTSQSLTIKQADLTLLNNLGGGISITSGNSGSFFPSISTTGIEYDSVNEKFIGAGGFWVGQKSAAETDYGFIVGNPNGAHIEYSKDKFELRDANLYIGDSFTLAYSGEYPYLSMGSGSNYSGEDFQGVYMGILPGSDNAYMIKQESGSAAGFVLQEDLNKILISTPQYIFKVGDAYSYLYWSGSALEMKGASISATTGTFSDLVTAGGGLTVPSGKTINLTGATVSGLSHSSLSGLNDNNAHPQYLLTSAKAADSDKLDGIDSTGFATASHDHSGMYLPVSGKAADADKLDGVDSTGFATASHNHDAVYLPLVGKAVDSDKLDGQDSTYFQQNLLDAVAIEFGYNRASDGFNYIDFHTIADKKDYDARIIVTGGLSGSSNNARANMEYIAASHTFTGATNLPRTISVRLAGEDEELTNKTYWTAYWAPNMLNGRTITRFTAYASRVSSGSTTVQLFAYNSSGSANGAVATATISANAYASNSPTISSTYKYIKGDTNMHVIVATSGSQIAKGLQINIEVL